MRLSNSWRSWTRGNYQSSDVRAEPYSYLWVLTALEGTDLIELSIQNAVPKLLQVITSCPEIYWNRPKRRLKTVFSSDCTFYLFLLVNALVDLWHALWVFSVYSLFLAFFMCLWRELMLLFSTLFRASENIYVEVKKKKKSCFSVSLVTCLKMF